MFVVMIYGYYYYWTDVRFTWLVWETKTCRIGAAVRPDCRLLQVGEADTLASRSFQYQVHDKQGEHAMLRSCDAVAKDV